MPRIVGVDIPNDKSILISLTYIVGIGERTSRQILKEAGIDENTKANKLSEDELSASPAGRPEHSTSARHRLLQGPSSPERFARQGPVYSEQRTHEKRPEEDSCR